MNKVDGIYPPVPNVWWWDDPGGYFVARLNGTWLGMRIKGKLHLYHTLDLRGL